MDIIEKVEIGNQEKRFPDVLLLKLRKPWSKSFIEQSAIRWNRLIAFVLRQKLRL